MPPKSVQAAQSLSTFPNSYVDIAHIPFELSAKYPVVQQLKDIMAAGPGVEPALIGDEPQDGAHRAIVVGYGPIGRSVVRLLGDNGIASTVIDRNHETIAALGRLGVLAIDGDASQREVLVRAGVAEAGSLIFSASGPPEPVIAAVRALNPNLRIVARAPYAAALPSLTLAGGVDVVCAEVEVALAIAERLLLGLGATRDQLDRERDRVRGEVSPQAATPRVG